MANVSIGPTLDRSVLGIMVDFGKAIPFHLEPGRWSEDTLPMVAAEGQTLGNLGGTTDNDLDSYASVTEHGNQRVDTKSIDLPAHQIADSWL